MLEGGLWRPLPRRIGRADPRPFKKQLNAAEQK